MSCEETCAPQAPNASPAGGTLCVYYDGACPLCRREIGFYRARAADVAIGWVDASSAETEALGSDLTRTDALARFHVRLPDGRLVSGARGFGELWARTPGFRWLGALARAQAAQPILELVYRVFLVVRPGVQKMVARFDADPNDAWLTRELRSNHAGESGAVAIYRGVLAVSRCATLRRFAAQHLATEQRHLEMMCAPLPRGQRSKLLPLWRVAGFVTGALPALFGARAVYATVETVETFVDSHYTAQIGRLCGDESRRSLRDTLRAVRDDELVHRDEARARLAGATSIPLRLWLRAVSAGSALGVLIARRV